MSLWDQVCSSQCSCFIERFGAYLGHLTSLSEDCSVKLADRQKLKGYVLRWSKCKVLLGCAFFHDVLKPVEIVCKIILEDELHTVRAIQAFLKAKKVSG